MLRFLFGAWLALIACVGHATVFVVGVPPIHSMRTLAERFAPLRADLEARLGQPVLLESAASFADYHARTLAGDFDLAITPAHLARLAQKERGFQPLAQFHPDHEALLVYHARRPLADLQPLRGQRLAVIDRLAVTVMASLDYLERRGLAADRDFRVVEYRNHAGVARALEAGIAVAGVTSSQGLQQTPESVRAQIKVHARLAGIPAFIVMAKPGVTHAEAARLQGMLLDFARGQSGRTFLRGVAYDSLTAADESSLKRVDAYLKETRGRLAQ
ncbi:MAG: PhnD/SsuA/transferrin family substrate-binding protein [Pseudomonadota bacterium]